MTSNSQLSTEFSEVLAIKLLSIVKDDCPQDSKPIDNVLPEEVLYLSFCDHCQRFYFNSFCEIVNRNK